MAGSREGRLLTLHQLLLAAPGSTEDWQRFLEAFCDALGGSAANFIANDLPSNRASVALFARTDPEAIHLYNAEWYRADPWRQHTSPAHLRSGTVVLGDDLIAHAQMQRTAFYNDFARHYGTVRCVAGFIEVEPQAFSCLTVNRTDRDGAFTEQDRAFFETLAGPLRRALQLHRRLAGAELTAASTVDVLDRLASGVLWLSRTGAVVHANRAGEEILRARDGLFVDRGELRAATPEATARLRNAVAGALQTATGDRLDHRTTVMLDRPSGKRRLTLFVAPLPARGCLLDDGQPEVAVFINDPDRIPLTDPEVLRAMFRLTRAEAQLLLALVDGASLKEAADRLQITMNTARSRLKVLFQKTECHTQAQLIRRVLLATTQGPGFRLGASD